MKRALSDEARCKFRVRCAAAQQVRLVIERRPGATQVFPLQARGDDVWETVLNLPPGEYRYCYHAYNGHTLTYLTPSDAVLDGLKAVLFVAGTQHLPTTNARSRAELAVLRESEATDDTLAVRA